MNSVIIEKLKEIETINSVSILLAVESGSRAWGFPSEDSDYDVRFIYAHKQEWYLSVFEKRDVIELQVSPLLDINGWDIRKAFQLLRKSNPTLLEWLSSTIVYGINEEALNPLMVLSKTAFLPESSCRHYLSIAKDNISKFAKGNGVRIKTYLYSLRPILCCRWVIEEKTQPPMLFNELLNNFLPEGKTRDEIDRLIGIKRDGKESDTIGKSGIIESYLSEQFSILNERIPNNPDKEDMEIFELAFRETLKILASDNATQWTTDSRT